MLYLAIFEGGNALLDLLDGASDVFSHTVVRTWLTRRMGVRGGMVRKKRKRDHR